MGYPVREINSLSRTVEQLGSNFVTSQFSVGVLKYRFKHCSTSKAVVGKAPNVQRDLVHSGLHGPMVLNACSACRYCDFT